MLCMRRKHGIFHHTDNIRNPQRKIGLSDYCNKTPEHYGIKSQPSNAGLGQIDHLSRSARGACRQRTHVVSQGKTPVCNAVQYRAQSAAVSAH